MECKHENADHLMPGQVASVWGGPLDGYEAACEQFRCLDCGAWLSLGPSKDDGEFAEAVAIEQRAAEIAAMVVPRENGFAYERMPYSVWCGFENMGLPFAPAGRPHGTEREYEAGYLARCIAMHEEPRT